MNLLPALVLAIQISSGWASGEVVNPKRCEALASYGPFENTTIISVSHSAAGSSVTPWGTCRTRPVQVSTSICRVQFSVRTSSASEVRAEAWLPDDWDSRFLATGNGGLGGCIDYDNLNYGSTLQFAVVASNNGHDGDRGDVFYKQPEILQDFAARSIHAITTVGKQHVRAYYATRHNKSYYIGCSTGGRQGTFSALHWPEDFDGIIAGAPATNWNRLAFWAGMLSTFVGAPNGTVSPSFIPTSLWSAVRAEIFRQCDALDGVEDGILDEPDTCQFDLEVLSCSRGGLPGASCLSDTQLVAVRQVYTPLLGADGEVISPRYSPGGDPSASMGIFSGSMFPYTNDWFRYVVHEDPQYNFTDFGLKDVAAADALDPFKVSTFSGNFTDYNLRGGKFMTYHGTHDAVFPHTNAKRNYDLAAAFMGESDLDNFYRFFVVPGMDHCYGGPGPFQFGQVGLAPPKNDAHHNILLALVDWVEQGIAPDQLIGTSSRDVERVLCKHPQRSVWDGSTYVCDA